MNDDITQYYFDSEMWDAPCIVDNEGNVVDTLNVSDNMYSWIVIHGKVYLSFETSHYGAIEVALMNIHHLNSVEQIEKKFGEPIDDICQDIRYSEDNECEGRFWRKYNLIEITGGWFTDNYAQQICSELNANINNVYIVGAHQNNMPVDCYPIKKYRQEAYVAEGKKKMIREMLEEDGEKFKPTIQWVSENYRKANEELFGGELGDCVFKAEPVQAHKNWLGMFSFGKQIKGDKRSRRLYVYDAWNNKYLYVNRDNFYDICRPTITMNTLYSGTEFSLYCTLVHEMCHYYTYMNGHFPRQAHGTEFRQIGAVVQSRSNNVITVQRLASAEQMEGYEVDAEVSAAKKRREENKANNMKYVIVYKEDGSLRLVTTTSTNVVNDVCRSEVHKNSSVLLVTNPELKKAFYDAGYRHSVRKYSYYPIKKEYSNYEIAKRVINGENGKDFEVLLFDRDIDYID